ncbi:MAG TPA: hypothetical protein VGF91_07495 [Solirubrobacteraceae bacterium]
MSDQPAAPGPVTATGTASANVDGQAIAITVFSTVKPLGRFLLPLVFWFATTFPKASGTLGRLSFIHFARWTLVRKIPFNGAPQREEKLNYPRLFFESNFNGGWEEYIDAFSHILTRGMKVFWGTSFGFPQPLPTAPFKDYIRNNQIVASHFYGAYPEATTTMVLSALELAPKLETFRAGAANMSPEMFAEKWRAFLADVQDCL